MSTYNISGSTIGAIGVNAVNYNTIAQPMTSLNVPYANLSGGIRVQLEDKIGTNWRTLGLLLGFDYHILETIEMNNRVVSGRVTDLLYRWRQAHGSRATVQVLYDALCKIPLRNVAEWLESQVTGKPNYSSPDSPLLEKSKGPMTIRQLVEKHSDNQLVIDFYNEMNKIRGWYNILQYRKLTTKPQVKDKVAKIDAQGIYGNGTKEILIISTRGPFGDNTLVQFGQIIAPWGFTNVNKAYAKIISYFASQNREEKQQEEAMDTIDTELMNWLLEHKVCKNTLEARPLVAKLITEGVGDLEDLTVLDREFVYTELGLARVPAGRMWKVIQEMKN